MKPAKIDDWWMDEYSIHSISGASMGPKKAPLIKLSAYLISLENGACTNYSNYFLQTLSSCIFEEN